MHTSEEPAAADVNQSSSKCLARFQCGHWRRRRWGEAHFGLSTSASFKAQLLWVTCTPSTKPFPVSSPSCTRPPLCPHITLPLSLGIYYKLYANVYACSFPPLGQKLMKDMVRSFSLNLQPEASGLAPAKRPVPKPCALCL